MKNEELFSVIRSILVEEFGADFEDVCLNTRINKDLGIEGDDAVEFFDIFRARTGISPDLNLEDYFMGESLFAKPKEKALTVSLLLELAEQTE